MIKLTASISSQVVVFFWCIFGGIIIGLLFDVFRLSRKIIPTSDLITYIEDVIFWLMVGVVVLVTVFKCNQGQLRGFVFLGMFLGTVFYFLIFSNLLMRCIIILSNFLQKIIKAVMKILEKPIRIAIRGIIIPSKFMWKLLKRIGHKNNSMCKKIFNNIKRSKKIIKEKV